MDIGAVGEQFAVQLFEAEARGSMLGPLGPVFLGFVFPFPFPFPDPDVLERARSCI